MVWWLLLCVSFTGVPRCLVKHYSGCDWKGVSGWNKHLDGRLSGAGCSASGRWVPYKQRSEFREKKKKLTFSQIKRSFSCLTALNWVGNFFLLPWDSNWNISFSGSQAFGLGLATPLALLGLQLCDCRSFKLPQSTEPVPIPYKKFLFSLYPPLPSLLFLFSWRILTDAFNNCGFEYCILKHFYSSNSSTRGANLGVPR